MSHEHTHEEDGVNPYYPMRITPALQAKLDDKPFYTADMIGRHLGEGYWADRGEAPRKLEIPADGVVNFHLSLNQESRGYALEAFQSWTNVTGIRFREVSRPEDATITIDDEEAGAFIRYVLEDGIVEEGNINISSTKSSIIEKYQQTFIHEIGHALGLGHAGNYNGAVNFFDDAIYANDSNEFTVMSYFNAAKNPLSQASLIFAATPQIGDISAAHRLYGTPDIARDDDVYGDGSTREGPGMSLPEDRFVSIFDGGGRDVIDLRSRNFDQEIDLRPGTHSNLNGYDMNFSIASNTWIEDVRLGSGNDRITGNTSNNLIEGGAGNDSIDGGYGFDIAHFDISRGAVSVEIDEDGFVRVRSDATGSDHLTSIENLSFGDSGADVDLRDVDPDVTGDMMFGISRLYTGYHGDLPTGHEIWPLLKRVMNGDSLADIASDLYVASDVPDRNYGKTASQIVDRLYHEVLGREPDAEGRAFWLDVVENGNVAEELLVLSFLGGADAGGTDMDKTWLQSRASLGVDLSIRQGVWDSGDTERPLEHLGPQENFSDMSLGMARANVRTSGRDADYGNEGLVVQVDGLMDSPYDFLLA